MVELAEAGAAGFTDDGHPVVSAGMMRRALQYSAVTGVPLALHEEEPTLSAHGQMHEGAVSAELGLAGWPSVAESLMVERDLALADYENRPLHLMHLSARESVDALRRAHERGIAATGEVTPHHLCRTDESVRSLDANQKMNPPLRTESDRVALLEALRDGTIEAVATDHAPARTSREGVPVRGGAVRRHGSRDGVRASSTRELVATGVLAAGDPARAHVGGPRACARAARPEDRRRRAGQHRAARPGRRVGGDRGRASGRGRPTRGSLGETLRGRVVRTIADGRDVFASRPRDGERMTAGYLVLEDGTVFHGRSVAADGVASARRSSRPR